MAVGARYATTAEWHEYAKHARWSARHEGANQEDGCWCTAMGSAQPPSMQCAAYNRLGTGVHGLSHVVMGHIGIVVHNNAQHDMQGLTAWLPVCVCMLTTWLACLGT